MNIRNMTKDQLIEEALNLGLELNGTETLPQLRTLVSGRSIDAKPDPNAEFTPKLSGRRVKVNVSPVPGNERGAFFALNGTGYLLEPGVDAEVPEELLGVMRDARLTTYKQDQIGSMIPREQLVYPFSVVP